MQPILCVFGPIFPEISVQSPAFPSPKSRPRVQRFQNAVPQFVTRYAFITSLSLSLVNMVHSRSGDGAYLKPPPFHILFNLHIFLGFTDKSFIAWACQLHRTFLTSLLQSDNDFPKHSCFPTAFVCSSKFHV